MDYFKIVATMEKRGVYFTLVPHKWEKNKLLFWPQHLKHKEREVIRSDASSEPQDSWLTFKCIVKLTKIKSFEEGLELEKQLTECTDTEAEEALFSQVSSKSASCSETIQNRNYMLENNSNSTIATISALSQPSISYEFIDNAPMDESNNLGASDTILFLNKPINESNISFGTSNIASDGKQELTSFKEDIKEELKTIRRELKDSVAKITAYLDEIHKKIVNISTSVTNNKIEHNEKNNNYEEIFKFPLSTTEDIEKVDTRIRSDERYKSQMIEFLRRTGGTSGQEDGTKVGYKVIDQVFTSQVLLNYSWTGISRGNKNEKKCFQNLQGILDVFFKVIFAADNRHTIPKNASIFKDGVLKHAKKRSLRKRPLLFLDPKNDEDIPMIEENSTNENNNSAVEVAVDDEDETETSEDT